MFKTIKYEYIIILLLISWIIPMTNLFEGWCGCGEYEGYTAGCNSRGQNYCDRNGDLGWYAQYY